MSPSQLVRRWIECFNAGDLTALVALYAPDATNHQVVFDQPLRGRDAIRRFFEIEIARADMVCNEEQLFEDGDWAILEWSDPLGLRGCGFFHVTDDQIIEQRGYFDQLTFFRIQGLPVPETYLD
ncbi:MAG: nuclear transport factor 2 family protein [Xanthomonadales bacterium]|nr:nuclear transport factor 2 family protein [Xanthomonadales bacterium]